MWPTADVVTGEATVGTAHWAETAVNRGGGHAAAMLTDVTSPDDEQGW